jgi:hypothetical protein
MCSDEEIPSLLDHFEVSISCGSGTRGWLDTNISAVFSSCESAGLVSPPFLDLRIVSRGSGINRLFPFSDVRDDTEVADVFALSVADDAALELLLRKLVSIGIGANFLLGPFSKELDAPFNVRGTTG